MAAKKTARKANPAFDFITSALKRNPKAVYATIRDNAAKKRLTIHPIMYGRAKALLGLVKISKRGEGKAKKAAARGKRSRLPGRRGPGRPRKVPSGLDGIVDRINELQKDRDRAVAVLEKIRALVDSV